MPDDLDAAGADLARWVRNRDPAALDRALAAAADAAHVQASRLLGHAADADDATQEALVQLVRSARRYDPVRPFRPWLARLVHDACCRLLRSGRRRRRREAAAPVPVPVAAAEVDADAVRAAVQELPEALRAAVELHYFAGLEQTAAAVALGIGVSACAMRLSRARERLRGLLQRRGIGAAAALALTTLAASPAHAASPALAAGVAAQAVAGTLPATVIPLTLLQTGRAFMTTHPAISTAIAALLLAALGLPMALAAGESAPPAPAPPQAAPPAARWSAPASALLPYLDAEAAFLLAGDLQTLRPQLLAAKPCSIFADPRLKAQWPALRRQLDGPLSVWPLLACRLAEHGRGLTVALHDTSRGRRVEQRTLLLADLGAGAADLQRAVAGRADRGAPPQVGPFTGLLEEDGTLLVARSGEVMAIASTDWLRRRLGAPAAAEPPAGLWFRCDAGPLLARYAAAARGADADPADVATILGDGWRGMRPLIEGRLAVAEGGITTRVELSRAGSCSPLVPLSLVLGGTTTLPLSVFADWPLRRPTIAIPASADRIATLGLGLTPPARLRHLLDDPLLRLLAEAWSGDLACEIRPGVPLPRAALALGLRPGADGAGLANLLAVRLGLPGQGSGEAFSGFVGGGELSIRRARDRLLVTWNAPPAAWPGLADARAPADAPACQLDVDLAAVARNWGPLALLTLPAEERALLPPLPLLVEHLPRWQLRWESAPDGCRIEERGLPLAAALIAAAAVRVVIQADPEGESQPALPLAAPEPSPTF